MKCKKCGKDVGKNKKVCENCGAKIKKDKRGLVIGLIIIIALVLALLSSNVIYNKLKYSEKDYKIFENQLKSAAKKYIKDIYIGNESSDEEIIFSDKSNIVKDDLDLSKYNNELADKCEGYVLISLSSDLKNTYKSYIKCGMYYTTKGYNFTYAKKSYVDLYESEEKEESSEYYIIEKDGKVDLGAKSSDSTKIVGDMYDESIIIGEYKCDSKNCDIVHNSDSKYDVVLISDDNRVVIYNYKTQEKVVTTIKYESYSNRIVKVASDNVVIGIIANNLYDDVMYYSISDKKVTINIGTNRPGDFNELSYYNSYIKQGYLIRYNLITTSTKISGSKLVRMYEDDYYSLVNMKTGKELNNSTLKNEKYSEINGVPIIIDEKGNCNLIDNNFKTVFEKTYSDYYEFNNKVYAYSSSGSRYGVYDKQTGSKIENEINGRLEGYYNNYSVTYDGSVVYIYNADTNSVIKKISYSSSEYNLTQTIILMNKENIDANGVKFNGIYLFLMNSYMNCSVYKINEANNTVDLISQNMNYCGY